MPPEVTEPVTAAPPAPSVIPNEAAPPETHAPLAADTLPPTAQEAAPGRLWTSHAGGLELAAKDPIVARQQYAELVNSYQNVLSRVRVTTANNGSAGVWNAWAVCDYHATNTSITTNDASVWNAWNTVGTSATSCGCTSVIDTAMTWGAWNAAQAARQMVYRARPTIEATPEQRARWEQERELQEAQEALRRAEYEAGRPIREAAQRQRAEEFRVAEEKRVAEQAQADARAKKLLVECLSPEQRDTLEQHNYFDVKVPSGQVYRIHKGWSHNVKRVKPDGTVERGTFCAHPSDAVPHYDNMLAQKFTLETDEAAFLRVANRG